jgi:hypothetical protein
MDYFEALELTAELTNNKAQQFLAPPDEKGTDYETWQHSDEAKLVLKILFRKGKDINLTFNNHGNGNKCLVLRKSGFAVRTETMTGTGKEQFLRTRYKQLTIAEAIAYGTGNRDLVKKLRAQAHMQILNSISTLAGVTSQRMYFATDPDFDDYYFG